MFKPFSELSVKNVSYHGAVTWRRKTLTYDELKPTSLQLQFGRAYILNSLPRAGAWSLSWIIGGALQATTGELLFDGKAKSYEERKQFSWIVRFSEIKYIGIYSQSVKAQLQRGIKFQQGTLLESVNDYVRAFGLSESRISRRLSQLSSEAWRASCAIGLANGAKVFCFPYIDRNSLDLISQYNNLWLKTIIDTLVRFNCLVILPTQIMDLTELQGYEVFNI
jgi:hypothetical protein